MIPFQLVQSDITSLSCPHSRQSKQQTATHRSTNRIRPTKTPANGHWSGQSKTIQLQNGKESLILYNDHLPSNQELIEDGSERKIQIYKNGFFTIKEGFHSNALGMVFRPLATPGLCDWLILFTVLLLSNVCLII